MGVGVGGVDVGVIVGVVVGVSVGGIETRVDGVDVGVVVGVVVGEIVHFYKAFYGLVFHFPSHRFQDLEALQQAIKQYTNHVSGLRLKLDELKKLEWIELMDVTSLLRLLFDHQSYM